MQSSFDGTCVLGAKWTSPSRSSLPSCPRHTQHHKSLHCSACLAGIQIRFWPLRTRHSPKYRAAVSLDGLAAGLRLEPYPKRSAQESIRGRDRAVRLRLEANHHQGKSSLTGLCWILQPDAGILHRRPEDVEWSGRADDGAATTSQLKFHPLDETRKCHLQVG